MAGMVERPKRKIRCVESRGAPFITEGRNYVPIFYRDGKVAVYNDVQKEMLYDASRFDAALEDK